jgi:hypothetical protein
MKKGIFPIYVLLILISCAKYNLNDLLSAPEIITVDNRQYSLETFLWRDFMPGANPKEGSDLYGFVYIVALDSLVFPSYLNADHVWIIKGDDVWDTELIDDKITPIYAYKLKKKLKELGPKWGPYIYVNVVVKIVKNNNSTYLIRSDSALILKTE